MGVSGLLTLLKSIQTPTHVRHFAGQTIGVDAYGWLHRGAVRCAVDLAQGEQSTKHVEFAMHRVRMLVHFGVIPYLVFDGDRLPSKAATELGRAERRRESKKIGMELLRLGKTAQAQQELQKAVDITPEMAGQLMEELRRNKIQFVVAPYEADSQMVYLESQGIIDAILSEDSDLLIFGAKTLLTKLDQYGECVMIKEADYTACREVNLTGWTRADLRCMAILSGCDYLEGIHQMGLKTAYRLVRKCKTIQRVIQCAQLEGKFRIPSGYLDSFTQADMTFLYQWVYCPKAKTLVNLTTPESEDQLAGLTYIGKYVEPEIARGVANGQLNPFTKLPMIIQWPSNYKQPPLIPRRTGKENAVRDNTNSKKINSFFTPIPNRTPLAELDPNSFTPSQSQSRVLEQNNARSWTPVHVNARPGPVQRPHNPIDIGSQQTRHPTSTPQPYKRQRLCAAEDSLGADALFNAHEERSRFFSAKTPQQGPTSGLSARGKSAKASDINIWSDDSVEDAMATLPNFGPRSAIKPGKAASLYKNRKLAINQDEQRSLTAEDEERKDRLSTGLKIETKVFRNYYTLKSQEPRNSPDAATQTTPSPDAEFANAPATPQPATPSADRLAADEPPSPQDTEVVATVEETPFEKKGVEVHSPSERKPINAEAPHSKASKDDKNDDHDDHDNLPPATATPRVPRVVRPKGSEDLLIVPDSDAETGCSECGTDSTPRRGSTAACSDDDGEEKADAPAGRRRAPLDLQRFAFGSAAAADVIT